MPLDFRELDSKLMRKKILILGHNDATQFIDIYNQYTRLFDPSVYEVTVAYLTGEPDEEIQKRLIAEQVVCFNLAKKRLSGLKLWAIYTLWRFCAKQQFELLICHRYKPTYLILCIARLVNIPKVISIMHELHTMSSRKRQLFIARLLRAQDLIAGVSNAVRDDLRSDLSAIPKEKIITLYNVMDIELTKPQLLTREAARAALKLSPEDFIFGNFARLVENKDQASLIQAFARIKASYPQAKLILMGSGILEQALKQQVKKAGLEHEIIFYGHVPQAFRYMKALDCFVLSSVQEAFGRVLLEAMLAEVPLIATAAHGIPEVLGTTGGLVRPKDVDALAEAMQKIMQLSLAERQTQAATAYQHLAQHFSIPIFHQQFWQHMGG
jgi:glycosyltransferase involved in cell wall biosynthesis